LRGEGWVRVGGEIWPLFPLMARFEDEAEAVVKDCRKMIENDIFVGVVL